MGLPNYLRSSVPNPASARAPWYKNTAPSYAGIFLAVIFYEQLATTSTLNAASLGVLLAALLVGGLISFALFYYAPAMLGMSTGRPFYIVATSTFGAQGNYLPGLMMGLLQVGFIGVITYTGVNFLMQGLHVDSRAVTIVVSILWAYALAWVAMNGIGHVAKAGNILNWIPLIMLLIMLFSLGGGISHFHPAGPLHPKLTFATVVGIVLGYFATAGAAGADFGVNSRNRTDVTLGGLVGVTLAVVVSAGLAILGLAGALGNNPALLSSGGDFTVAISSVGALSGIVFLLFAVALLVPQAFSTFIGTNSFTTMLGGSRALWAFLAATAGILLAITGLANNLLGFFGIVGATFGPVCGAMAADYWLSGGKWSGPREGINWAGYLAWVVGCWVGLMPTLHLGPASWQFYDNPAPLYSMLVTFVIYAALAKAGLQSALVKDEAFAATAKS